MGSLVLPEGLLDHGKPGGSSVQLAQVCQPDLALLQLAVQPFDVRQAWAAGFSSGLMCDIFSSLI